MIVTFDTTHHALWAEEIALARGLGVDVVPAPADSGAKCDLALEDIAVMRVLPNMTVIVPAELEVLPEDREALVSALREQGVPHRLYRAG